MAWMPTPPSRMRLSFLGAVARLRCNVGAPCRSKHGAHACSCLGGRPGKVGCGSLLLLTVAALLAANLVYLMASRRQDSESEHHAGLLQLLANISDDKRPNLLPTVSDPLPYTLFTNSVVYQHSSEAEPVRPLTDRERSWFKQMRMVALDHLSPDTTNTHFQYGWYRHLHLATEWELVFASPVIEAGLQSVRLIQPLRLPRMLHSSTVPHNMLVHMVVFASGNSSSLDSFVSHLSSLVLPRDSHISLLVLSPSTDLQPTRDVLGQRLNPIPAVRWSTASLATTGPHPLTLLGRSPPEEPERRWDLLLLLDEMIILRQAFVGRCRTMAIKQRQMYFAGAFSLYDPELLYRTMGQPVPPIQRQLQHSADVGSWTPNKHRVACIYRGDLASVWGNGFSSTSSDEQFPVVPQLYKASQHTNITAVHIPDPDVFIRHSSINCTRPPSLLGDLVGESLGVAACLRKQAASLGSRLILGLSLLQRLQGTDITVVWQAEQGLPVWLGLVLVAAVCCCTLVTAVQSLLLGAARGRGGRKRTAWKP